MAVVDFIHLRMLVGVRAYVYIGGGRRYMFVWREGHAFAVCVHMVCWEGCNCIYLDEGGD